MDWSGFNVYSLPLLGYTGTKQAEEKRAVAEDGERSRAFDQAVKELKASNTRRKGEIEAQLHRERFG